MSENGENSGDPQALAPALTAREWAILQPDPALFSAVVDGALTITAYGNDGPVLARQIAALNHALPADHPLKLTHADVAVLQEAADETERTCGWQKGCPMDVCCECMNDAWRIRTIAEKLAALLPPPDVAG